MNYSLPEIKFDVKFLQKFLQSNILLYCVVLLLALKIVTVFVSINIPQNIFFADITKATLENFVNQTRQSFGLQPLVDNQKLDQAAQLKAENMVANNYFAHTSPTGVTPWYWFLQAGYNYKYAGENLAIGFFDSEEVYKAWLNSPEHKANILNPNYKEFGTAVLNGFGPNNSIVVVQEFGSQQQPIKNAPAPANNNPKPVVAPQKQNPVTQPKVLSQSTEPTPELAPEKTVNSSPYSDIINSFLFNYDGILQNVIYGISLVVIGLLLLMIFLNLNFKLRKELVIRSALIVILLSVATLLNRELIISIIPHQIFI